jgi:alpha-tubulin suppressor-like RCC1 family protein
MSIFLGKRVLDTSTTWTTNGTDISLNASFTGNVGVGISNPAYKLDVSGDTRVRGIMQVGSIPDLAVQDTLDWSANGLVRFTMKNIGIGITNPTNAVEVSGNVAVSSNINNSGQVCKTGNPSVATISDIKSIDHYGNITCSDISTSMVYTSSANIGFTDSSLYHTNVDISGDIYASGIVMSYDNPYDFSVRGIMSSDHAGFQRTESFSYINKHGILVGNAPSGTSLGGATARKTFYFPAGYENEEVDKIYSNYLRTMIITKNGYVFSLGQNNNNSSGVDGSVVASGTTLTELTRSFTRDVSGIDISNVKFSKILLPEGDPQASYALTVSGDLYAVGYNQYGQLSDNSTTETNLKTIKCPNLVQFDVLGRMRNFVKDAVIMGSYFNDGANWYPNTLCVLDNSGGVWTVGSSSGFQTGQGNNTTDYRILMRVKTSASTTLNGSLGSVIIKSIYGFGFDIILGFMALSTTGKLYAWGNNSSNTMLNGGSSDISHANIINSNIAAGIDVSNVWLSNDEDGPFIVQATTGNVYGTGQYYGLGTGLTSGTGWRQLTHFNTTTIVLQNIYTVIGSGNVNQSNFAITRNSTTGRYTLWATGDNTNGQLGVGNTTYQNRWVNVGLHNDIVSQIKNIVGHGSLYTCIILNSGRLLFAGQRIPLYNDTTDYLRFTYLS